MEDKVKYEQSCSLSEEEGLHSYSFKAYFSICKAVFRRRDIGCSRLEENNQFFKNKGTHLGDRNVLFVRQSIRRRRRLRWWANAFYSSDVHTRWKGWRRRSRLLSPQTSAYLKFLWLIFLLLWNIPVAFVLPLYLRIYIRGEDLLLYFCRSCDLEHACMAAVFGWQQMYTLFKTND